jgi:hypothetical protein
MSVGSLATHNAGTALQEALKYIPATEIARQVFQAIF